jgi:hypothetical protein
MAKRIIMKNSSVAGRIPATSDLVGGELAVNTTDGKLFLKKTTGGVDSIVEIGGVNLTNIATNIVPATDNIYDLGSPSKTFRHVYIGPGSLYVNGKQVITDNSDTIEFKTDENQDVRIKTTGSGDIELQTDTNGLVKVIGTLQIQDGKQITNSAGNALEFGVGIKTNMLTSRDTNTDLTLSGNGSGAVRVADDLVVTGNLTINGTTTTINAETISLADNIIDLNSNFTTGTPTENAGIRVMRGDDPPAQIRWNESTDKWEFTNDGSAFTNLGSGGSTITVTDAGGDGSLSYNSGTGVITYTGPSATEVRAHFSAGTGVTLSSGQISIGQAVGTTDNVTFASVTLAAGPVNNLHAATKAYVDNAVSNVGSSMTFTAATAPHNDAILGDRWFDTVNNRLYEYINDGATDFWLEV